MAPFLHYALLSFTDIYAVFEKFYYLVYLKPEFNHLIISISVVVRY